MLQPLLKRGFSHKNTIHGTQRKSGSIVTLVLDVPPKQMKRQKKTGQGGCQVAPSNIKGAAVSEGVHVTTILRLG